jgi:hypothetical protein
MIPDPNLVPVIQRALDTRGFRLAGATLAKPGGTPFGIPDLASVEALADLPSAVPSRARGDLREKVLYNIAQDLGGVSPALRLADTELRDGLGERVGGDRTSQQFLAAVMARQYWVQPTRRAGAVGSPFLTPFHSFLPGAFDYRGRYKSFRGSLLIFLSWDGSGFDLEAARRLASFLASSDGLTLLDRELLRVAGDLAGEHGVPDPVPSADRLVEMFGDDVRERLAAGCFDLDGLRRMRQDLISILELPLPRHDKTAALVQGLSVNLALYYYRLAFTLGDGIEACVRTAAGGEPGTAPDFTGRLLFRVGSGGDRPVRLDEPCSQSFLELDGRHLLALPASMATANLLHTIATTLGLAPAGSIPDPHGLAVALSADRSVASRADALAAVFAICIADASGDANTAAARALEPGTGCYALREAVLDDFRARGSTLKQRGRDVVHQLVGGYVGGLKRSRGRVNFFELDESVLFLLVKLILARSGEEQVPFRAEFLPALAAYGLKPQDRHEEDELAGSLERLGLLRRYSDAGEALYVSQSN